MNRKYTNNARRPPRKDSYQIPSYANLISQNPIQVAVQLKSIFVNASRENIEIDPIDPDQTIATPEETKEMCSGTYPAIFVVLHSHVWLSKLQVRSVVVYSELTLKC
ncbi:MAG: hypothetical protein EZS28_004409 [Streblomastix strix]|uniref:Uncharacterized protein n=1 Tax=Streblomastix strix TaxID=222440 RepID=A0A5J4WYW9_9EUKA|nr:MAG: hypothetical protein EZS28_004409 [Streblomastix strix]